MELQELWRGLFFMLQQTWLAMGIKFLSTEIMICRARTFSLLEILPHACKFWYKMIQFSCRNEKITRLFSIIFWILAVFHVIFGCIAQLIYVIINYLSIYQIVILDIVDIRYTRALLQWIVNKRIL